MSASITVDLPEPVGPIANEDCAETQPTQVEDVGVGHGRGVRVAPGPFPVPARRTGYVEIHITGCM